MNHMGKLFKNMSFTLVELLLVIATIAILASLLLPALKIMRDQAKAISCESNQKQCGTATIGYVSDNSDWIPFAYHSTEINGNHYATPSTPAWYCLLAPYLGLSARATKCYFYKLGKNEALEESTVFSCPRQYFSYPNDFPVSYSPELRIGNDAPLRNNQKRGKMEQIIKPSTKSWLNEIKPSVKYPGHPAVFMNGGVIIPGNNNDKFSNRHQGTGNVLFFDMHSYRVLYADVRSPSSGTVVYQGLFDIYR
jgi:prepilin-type processing-associated H-X9-DG protein